MGKDLCEHCGTEAERTGKLDIAARCYGGFLCDPCLVGYEGVLHAGIPKAPRSAIDNLFHDAAAAGFEPGTEEQAQAMREKLQGVSAQIHGGRR